MRKAPAKLRLNGSTDNYLHAVLLLTDGGRPAETSDLAAKIGVSPAAVSQMLKALVRKKLVTVEPYQGTRLTTEGLHRALRAVRRHRLLEFFFHKSLGFDLQECHARAQSMAGIVDRTFEDRLAEFLGNPKFDPHGEPIPSRDATWPKESDASILTLPPGTTGKLSRITSDETDVVRYLHLQGLIPGVQVIFHAVAPFDGPVSLSVAGKPLHLSRRLAEVLYLDAAPTLETPPSDRPPSRPGRKCSAADVHRHH